MFLAGTNQLKILERGGGVKSISLRGDNINSSLSKTIKDVELRAKRTIV